MFGGDGDKSHLAMGLAIGATQRAKHAEEEVDRVHDALIETKRILEIHAGDSITKGADRDAWRALALHMIAELQDPSRPRRFSDPDGNQARANLLQQVHRQTFETTVGRSKITGTDKYLPNAYKRAKDLSLKTVYGYPEDVKPKQHPVQKKSE